MKDPKVYFEVLDFSPRKTGLVFKKVIITEANEAMMKRSNMDDDTNLYSIARLIWEKYAKQRIDHIAIIHLTGMDYLQDIFHDLDKEVIKTAMNSLIQFYKEEFPDMLLVNAIPYELWNLKGLFQAVSEDYIDLFEGCGFIRIDLQSYNYFIPRGIMLYTESAGGNLIVNNEKKWW